MKNKSISSKYFYLVEYASSAEVFPLKLKWDGASSLLLGYPLQWTLEVDGDQLYCRDLLFSEHQKFSVHVESFDSSLTSQKDFLEFEIENQGKHSRFSIRRFSRIIAAEAGKANSADVPVLSMGSPLPTIDALLFHRSLKQVSASALVFLIGFSLWTLVNAPKKEDLIPAQYAKLILKKTTKSTESSQTNSSSGGAVRRAKDSAVAQAFRSHAVQKSVQSLLRGGLSKFTTAFAVPSAKALGALADAVKNTHDKTGAFRGLASQALGSGSGVGVASVGAGSGYGSGTGDGASVAGQGKGFVSLDTQEATVDEGLTKEEVARVIHAHMSEIRYCYESAILKNSNLEGKLLIDFQIEAAGLVKNANKKESSVSEASVSECVIRRLLTWQFPKPRGAVTVAISYPFLFKTVKR